MLRPLIAALCLLAAPAQAQTAPTPAEIAAYTGLFRAAHQGDAAEIGKATGKDAGAGKATLVALHGAEWARRQLDGLLEQAHVLLEPYGEDALVLREAARFVANRSI